MIGEKILEELGMGEKQEPSLATRLLLGRRAYLHSIFITPLSPNPLTSVIAKGIPFTPCRKFPVNQVPAGTDGSSAWKIRLPPDSFIAGRRAHCTGREKVSARR